MEDQKILAELTRALAGIQVELQQINKTLSAMTAAQGRSSAAGESLGRPPMARPVGRGPKPSRPPAGRPPASRGPKAGAYKRSEDFDGPGEKEPFRFAAAKKSPSRPKGKLPAKKGDGYPKKR